jgi:MinD-like ATPase involved in chromosome partitioning or flagellar assembly/FixJ family two-component response regulator
VSQPLKVLLIEDNRIEARQTQQWLDNAKDVSFKVECAYRMKVALDRLSRGGIDIILLDLNLPDSRGLETFITLHDRAPHIPIVVLTGEDDESIGASAVAKGAQDYLIKHQVDGTRLARVLRYAHVRQQAGEGQVIEPKQLKSARVVGFLGAKGGVGTTTVALNVALALAKQQKSVILVELRPSFGTLAYQLRQQPGKTLRTILDDFPDHCNERDLEVLLCKGPAELRILFGPQQADLFKEIDPGHAEAVIKGLASMADFVILDLPNQSSIATQTAVRLCQFVIVVTERTLDSVVSAKVAISQLQVWGVGVELVGTVIVNRTENPSPVIPTDIQTRLGCDIVGVVPPGTPANFQILEAGAPVVITIADQVAASFMEIADHFSADHDVARVSQNRLTSVNGQLS